MAAMETQIISLSLSLLFCHRPVFSIEDVGLAGCRPFSASLDEVLSDQLQAVRDASEAPIKGS